MPANERNYGAWCTFEDKFIFLLHFSLDVIYFSCMVGGIKTTKQNRIGAKGNMYVHEAFFGPGRNLFHPLVAELIFDCSHGRKGVNDHTPTSAGSAASP